MDSIHENWVAVFAKRPEPGRVKTRLNGCLGVAGAAELYEALLADTLGNVCQVRDSRHVIAYSPDTEVGWFASAGAGFGLMAQGEGEFGVRLARVFGEAFRQGAKRVVVVGSDMPTLQGEWVEEAYRELGSHEVVIGPARDGGYYLLGLSREVPELFVDVDWSTERVLGQTVRCARRLGLRVKMLQTGSDVDDEASLRELARELAKEGHESRAPRTARFLRGLGQEFLTG